MVNSGTNRLTSALEIVNSGTNRLTSALEMVNSGTSRLTSALEMVNSGTNSLDSPQLLKFVLCTPCILPICRAEWIYIY